MRTKLSTFLVVFGFLFLLNVPLIALGQGWSGGESIVVCKEDCGWVQLVELINRVISFLLYLVTILAVLTFMYAGFLLMTSGGSESKAKEAKDLFFKVVVGLIFAYGAWILVYFILSALQVRDGFKLI
jgi:hypothetical protein